MTDPSDLHRAQDALERDIERIGGGLQLDRLVREAERRDVLLVDEEIRGIHDGIDLRRREDRHFRWTRKGHVLPERLRGEGVADLGQP